MNRRTYRNPHLKRHIEIPFVVALHLLIASALGLIGAGASALTSPNPQSSFLLLVKIGIVILLLSWLIILGMGMLSLQPGMDGYQRNERHAGKSRQYTNGTIVSTSSERFPREERQIESNQKEGTNWSDDTDKRV